MSSVRPEMTVDLLLAGSRVAIPFATCWIWLTEASMSVPKSNWTATVDEPSVDVEVISCTPLRPWRLLPIGSLTCLSTASGAAPA
jgi:hypothetical protein